jgi:hypothetical protein
MMSRLLVVLILGKKKNSYSLPQRKRAGPQKKQGKLHRKKMASFFCRKAHF